MTKTLDILEESLREIPGCQVSSVASRKNGLTLFRSGDVGEDVDLEKLNREVAKLFSSSLVNPYGDAWNLPNISWLQLKFTADKLLYAVPLMEDYFWSFILFDVHPRRKQQDVAKHYLPKIVRDFEEARNK